MRQRGSRRSSRPAPPAPGSAASGTPLTGTERASAVVLAVLAVGSLWLWAAGAVAGMLAHGEVPAVGLLQAPGLLWHIPGCLPDLRAAWPASARPVLPGNAALGAVLAATALLLVAAGVAMGAALQRRARAWERVAAAWSTGGGGARWATGTDLRSLRVREAAPGRLVIGTSGRRLLATEARHSLLVLGPTQSGKTTGLAVPAILEWQGPVVATSVKDDLAGATLAWRHRAGPAWVFDPTASTALGAQGTWSPLSECGTWAGAQRMAAWLVESTPARTGMADGAFWFAAAAKLLAPLLLASACAGAAMAEVVQWTDLGDYEEPLDVLADAGEREARIALEACAGRDERLRSSVGTTLETVLAPFADPAVRAATGGSTIDISSLLSDSGTLYLCGPSHEQFRVQGLFAAIVASVTAAAVERAHRNGGPLDPPLLLVLDEAANIAPLRDLDTLASTAAGLGIQLVTVCQDLSQVAARYGSERARTIANNHRAKLMLSGVADIGTLDLVSGLAGEAQVREHSDSRDFRDGRRTRTSTMALRRLAPPDQLRRIRPGTGVLVYGHLPAASVALRPWFANPELRARASVPFSAHPPAIRHQLGAPADPSPPTP